MTCLVLKETLKLLKRYTVFAPYKYTPMALQKSADIEIFRHIYGLIPNPVYTHN